LSQNRVCEGKSSMISVGNGDEGIRTLDLRLAKPALSQLSYIPGARNIYPLLPPVSRKCYPLESTTRFETMKRR
jgi:hypothetical protein